MAAPEWIPQLVNIIGGTGGAAATAFFARLRSIGRASRSALKLAGDAHRAAQSAQAVAASTAKDFEALKQALHDEIARWKRGSIVDSPQPDAVRIGDLAESVARLQQSAIDMERRLSGCEDDLDTHAKEDTTAFLEIHRGLTRVEVILEGSKTYPMRIAKE